MEEKKVVKLKKEEFAIREFVINFLGKGKVSKVRIEYSPIGEKIIISTHKPGLVVGRGGERIEELTNILKSNFNLENPHIEIEEIKIPELNAQLMADEIALSIERFGPLKFKVIAYKTLQKIIDAGARGAEIRLSGKLPSSRAKSWRFSYGYLKKIGDSAKVVDKAMSIAQTKPGTVGVKVSILPPDVELKDNITIDENLISKIKENVKFINEDKNEGVKKIKKKKNDK
ncbi:MAG: 30S ribosomal protein S3 [Candidatus Pacearchaeota archaeon]|nr:MAG: 30S ribosomal protein S3 [Candidatus Pacearchaeota archaeon]